MSTIEINEHLCSVWFKRFLFRITFYNATAHSFAIMDSSYRLFKYVLRKEEKNIEKGNLKQTKKKKKTQRI